ncbi:MAG: hypothetical protein V4477_20430 [Pseudomonadota bacterium]
MATISHAFALAKSGHFQMTGIRLRAQKSRLVLEDGQVQRRELCRAKPVATCAASLAQSGKNSTHCSVNSSFVRFTFHRMADGN